MKLFPSDLRDCAILGGVDLVSEERMKVSGMALNQTDVTKGGKTNLICVCVCVCVKIFQLFVNKGINDAV